jgi:hypothetical protein
MRRRRHPRVALGLARPAPERRFRSTNSLGERVGTRTVYGRRVPSCTAEPRNPRQRAASTLESRPRWPPSRHTFVHAPVDDSVPSLLTNACPGLNHRVSQDAEGTMATRETGSSPDPTRSPSPFAHRSVLARNVRDHSKGARPAFAAGHAHDELAWQSEHRPRFVSQSAMPRRGKMQNWNDARVDLGVAREAVPLSDRCADMIAFDTQVE